MIRNSLVSIIMPCYNYEKYVRQAIICAISQTYPVDVHVVEDCSTDNTKAVIEKLLSQYPDSFTIHYNSENMGMIRSVNNMIDSVDSEYIAKLDADDLIFRTAIEELVPILDNYPDIGIAYSMFSLFGTRSNPFESREYDPNYLRTNNFIPSFNLFRKEAWLDAGKYNEEFSIGFDDWNLWLSMAEKGWYGKLLPKLRYLYRKHAESMDTEAQKRYADVCRLLMKNHPDCYKGLTLQQLYNIGGYPGVCE